MLRSVGIAAALLFTAVPVSARAADYEIDASHTRVGFATKHLMVATVRGEFAKASGTLRYDPQRPEATVLQVEVDVTSIDTGDPKRDVHLKAPDFFDADKFQTATFRSKKVEPAGEGKLKVTGELTLRGITKPLVLEVSGPSPEAKSPWGQTVVAATATGKINRKDFGMTWNKTLDGGGLLLADTVDLLIDAELVKKLPQASK